MSRTTSAADANPHEVEERRQSSANDRGLDGGAGHDDGIPEDDGMHSLRAKLHELRLLAISTDERARRMHDLMTKDYLAHMASNDIDLTSKVDSISINSPPPTNELSHDNPYHLRPGDLEPTFSPLPARPSHTYEDAHETVIDDEEEEDMHVLGCIHYKRNVKVQCFDCERWYPCRHCHDAARDLPFQHNLNRKKTKNMLCMLCKTPQPAAEICRDCGEYAAWYYCSKCKLWDNDSNKRIYHCDDCGLCRIGEGLGKDFVHCRRCNVCISISTSAAHPCIERATDSDCPLCLTYLFESQTPVVSLPCGHYMHGECYKDLMAVTYKCPVCNKSAVNMETQWRKMDDEIEAQPMPEDDQDLANLMPHIEEVAAASSTTEDNTSAPEPRQHRPRRPRLVWVGCNDCGGRCYTPFHWLGLKCQVCGGYNTNQMAPPAGRESETERVLRQQAQHCQHDFTGNFVLRDGGIGIEDDPVDSAYARSSSPSSNSARIVVDKRASEAPNSPGRRYFVQLEEPRRSSFTAPRFTTPSMPNLSQLPRMVDLPSLQDMSLPSLPQMQMPTLSNLPNMPNIGVPRFSPYEMVAVLSRSLSPMRYYREGLDRRDDFRRSMGSANWRNSAPAGSFRDEVHGDLRSTMPTEDNLGVSASQDRAEQSMAGMQQHASVDNALEDDDDDDDDDFFEELIGHR